MAKAASAGLMAHQHVESAIVTISGSPGHRVFHLTCALVPDIDQAAVMELVTRGVVPNIERMIGERFASRDLRFFVATVPEHGPLSHQPLFTRSPRRHSH